MTKLEFIGELLTGDFLEKTMTFEIEGEIILRAGRYKIVSIDEQLTNTK